MLVLVIVCGILSSFGECVCVCMCDQAQRYEMHEYCRGAPQKRAQITMESDQGGRQIHTNGSK